jgi:CheY-like chemotaxis protein
LFERFRQEDSTATRAHGGLGLGLAIVRHLVELHGGRVEAESVGPGHGSRFTLHLPARRATAPPAVALSTLQESPGPDLSGVAVLVVDDEGDARDLVASILRHHGATVRTAASGDAALTSLDASTPQVLVVDIAMPGEDGYSLLERVRRMYATLPAVALTAYARPDDRRRALDAGFELHLAKPIEPEELLGAVADLAGRGR